jgi:hypothetical protein
MVRNILDSVIFAVIRFCVPTFHVVLLRGENFFLDIGRVELKKYIIMYMLIQKM